MLSAMTYYLTTRERGLANYALGGLEFLPFDAHRDEHDGKPLQDDAMPQEVRDAVVDIGWLLRPSGQGISAKRRLRVLASLRLLHDILTRQAVPTWWAERGAPTHLAETRYQQRRRVEELYAELRQTVDTDPDQEEDDG